MRYRVRLTIVDSSGSISLGRLRAGGESDILRRTLMDSRYRELCIRLLPSLIQRQMTMLVALADRLNPTSCRDLQPPLAYCVTEFGRRFVRRQTPQLSTA